MSIYYSYADELYELFKKTIGTFRGREMTMDETMEKWIDETARVSKEGKKVFFIGNGASATMAEHLGFDAMQNGLLKTINFAETSYLTAVSNDFSYEEVFLLKLERMAEPGDMLVSISSSGNSPNIVRALEYAKERGMYTVALSGMSADNKSRELSDLSIYVPAETYGLTESVHSGIMHGWLDMYMGKYLGGRH